MIFCLCDMDFTLKRICWLTLFSIVLVNELYWQEISTQGYTKCTGDLATVGSSKNENTLILIAFFLHGVRADKNKR